MRYCDENSRSSVLGVEAGIESRESKLEARYSLG